ncbi:hypothetical protein GF406_13530 [candidate division KSB1 bacterium]|nr:hypothetical protein [candidate division KSB1 bacterium]
MQKLLRFLKPYTSCGKSSVRISAPVSNPKTFKRLFGGKMQRLLVWAILLPMMVSAQSAEDELVRVKEFMPDIVFDLKYSSLDNFTNQKLYSTDECYLAINVVRRLKLVQDSLCTIREHNGISYPRGLGLKIWDGYRPRTVQVLMWEIIPDPISLLSGPRGHNSATIMTS